MPQPLYTPFFRQGAQDIAGGFERRGIRQQEAQEKQLYGQAYMGDPQARQRLAQTRPDLMMQIDQADQKRKQTELSNAASQRKIELSEESANMKKQEAIQKVAGGIYKSASDFESYEDWRTYVEREKERYRPSFGDTVDQFDNSPLRYEQARMSRVENVQRSIEVPGKGINLIYEDGTIDFKPYSVEAIQAYQKSLERDVLQAGAEAEAKAASTRLVKSRADLRDKINIAAFRAEEQKPRLDKLLELSKVAQTGTFGEKKVAFKRLFGVDVADEEVFMAESNRVILDAADALKGALSDRENEYLEAVGPGIGKSMEGNIRIIQNIISMNNNAIARKNAFREFKGTPSEFSFVGQPLGERAEEIIRGGAEPSGIEDISDEDLLNL